MTTGLTAEEFGELYVKHIGCRFGLPESIITDRDPRWTADFWRGVAKYLKTRMSLSSSHHPQHDGQTEIVNKQLATMLRAYVNDNLSDWSSGYIFWNSLTIMLCTALQERPLSSSLTDFILGPR